MTRFLMALLATFTFATATYAHEGHDHKIMGTVAMIHDMHLEVKTTDGKTSTVTLSDATKILRGKESMARSDIKTGDRVVVTATQSKDKDGKPLFLAKEIRLGTSPPAAAK
jgi:translation initiation factor IF-1